MDKNIVKLAVDLARNRVQNYSADESNEILRKAFADLMEYSTEGNGKIDRKTFRKHKVAIFEILEEIINETVNEGFDGQFDSLVEYRNLAWGDKNSFQVPANQNFRVALVSDGNSNLRRQRLRDGQEFSVDVDTYAIKIGEDFGKFLAGRLDWTEFVSGVAQSFVRNVNEKIYGAITANFGKFGSEYHKDFTSGESLTEDDIITMAMHIEARTGEKVNIYGTKLALRSLPQENVTEKVKDAINETGYYGKIAGIPMFEIPQSHKYGSDEFLIDNHFVLLIPESGDRMVKVINEGDAIVVDVQGTTNSDMMQEYFISNKFGVAVICSKVYGAIKF